MVIVITKPEFFEGEAEQIVQLLDSDKADIVHIRKPVKLAGLARLERLDGALADSARELEKLIKSLPERVYGRLVLHDCFDLALKYQLHGVHLNSRHPQPPEGFRGAISISCHSLKELAECRKKPYAYMSLSPIFDSISKPGYYSAFTVEDIAEARRQGLIDERVMALGGVTFDKVNDVLKMGFGGAMILGDAWKLY
jgi:thiamine-phosphate pyrophosphorylase